MAEIPIVTFRSKQFSDYQLHLLRGHTWFMHEGPGTICFRPDVLMSERRGKSVLTDWLEGKGCGLKKNCLTWAMLYCINR